MAIKKIVLASIAGLLGFFILGGVLYLKSYYPYRLDLESDFKFASYVDIGVLEQRLRNPISDGMGGTYYFDSVSRQGERLIFAGRYYSVLPADLTVVRRYLRQEIGTIVGRFYAENICLFGVDLNQEDIRGQLEGIGKKTVLCNERLAPQLEKGFDFSKFEVSQEGRLKKILFLSLIVCLFLGIACYIILESIDVSSKS